MLSCFMVKQIHPRTRIVITRSPLKPLRHGSNTRTQKPVADKSGSDRENGQVVWRSRHGHTNLYPRATRKIASTRYQWVHLLLATQLYIPRPMRSTGFLLGAKVLRNRQSQYEDAGTAVRRLLATGGRMKSGALLGGVLLAMRGCAGGRCILLHNRGLTPHFGY